MRRPLVWTTTVLLGGGALASSFALPYALLSKLFVLTWILALTLTLSGRRTAAAMFTLGASFLLGACLYLGASFTMQTPDPLAQRYGFDRPAETKARGFIGECILPEGTDERLTFVLDVTALKSPSAPRQDWVPVKGRTLVNWYDRGAPVREADMVEVAGKIRLLKGFKNPDAFDYENHMYRRGVYSRIVARGPEAVTVLQTASMSAPSGWKHLLRRRAAEIISRSVQTAETQAFLSAILLGDRSLLSTELKDWFRQTGTFHILAISGLHVGLVYLIASLALAPFALGMKRRAAISILIVWLYAFITGAGVPVTRASIMLTLVLAGYLLDREGDFLTAVAAAAFILFVFNPLSIDEVSFQLSFAAVVLLCSFEPLFSKRFYPFLQRKLPSIPSPILHKFAVTLFASVVVGIGLLPIVAYHFNQISLVFPFANLLVVPLLSVALAFGFASLIGGTVSLHIAALFGLGAELASQAIFGVVRTFAALPWSFMRIASPPLWILALLGVGTVLLWWKAGWKRKTAFLACCAAAAMVTASACRMLSGDAFRVTFFDVGDADACFLEFPSNGTMLVDTGFSTPHLDCGEHLIAPFFWRKNISAIDSLVLTHPDADHCGGAPFILENFRVRRLILPDIEQMPARFAGIVDIARRRGTEVQFCATGDTLSATPARVEVLNPPRGSPGEGYSSNEMSVVLQVTCRDLSLLLTGDAEKEALRVVARAENSIKSRILKAPHHGLASSFSKRFVRRVDPDLVVISGRAFRSNDCIDQRISRYASLGGQVLSTERNGAVTVESDGFSTRIRTCRPGLGVSF